jgi:hypothetical protein
LAPPPQAAREDQSSKRRNSNCRLQGTTRHLDEVTAQELSKQQSIEMVKADLADTQSLTRAFHNAHIIFAGTDFYETMRDSNSWNATNVEYQRGVNIAIAALSTSTLEHFIWSTLPSAHKVSGEQ